MNIISLLHLSAFLAEIMLIILVLSRNPSARLNRSCAAMVGTMAIWSFFMALANVAQNIDWAMSFFNLSSVGWSYLPSFILLFHLSLANKDNIIQNKLVIAALFLLPLFFIYQQWTGNMMNLAVQTDLGWVSVWGRNFYSYSYLAVLCSSIIVSALLLVSLAFTAKTAREKKLMEMLIAAGLITVITGLGMAILFQFSGFRINLQVANIFSMIWVAGIVFAISRYGLMGISPGIAAEGILKTTSDSIMLLDSAKKVVYANEAACNMLGWRANREKEWENTVFSKLVVEREKAEKCVDITVESGKNSQIELSFRAANGIVVPVLASASAVKEANGHLMGFVVSAVDISEIKQMEEKLIISNERLKKTLMDTIDAMGKIVELRDPYTSGHQRRVALLAVAIAQEMRMDEKQVENLRLAALIHDIGKVYIPSDILSKPGVLSQPEYQLLKTHARGGYDVIKNLDFPPVMAQSVLQHHERLNGSGYPQGLKDDDIVVEAKILAVADVIEAMASNRPYRAALGVDKALDEIDRNRGTLYDPEVVEACLRLFREKGFKFE